MNVASGKIDLTDIDLSYVSKNSRYSFCFEQIDLNIFLLHSEGYIDNQSLKYQIEIGNQIRTKIEHSFPESKYYLIWDATKLNGSSVLARQNVYKTIWKMPSLGMVAVVGAKPIIKSFGTILARIITGFNLGFFSTREEAIQQVRIFRDRIEKRPFNNENEMYGNVVSERFSEKYLHTGKEFVIAGKKRRSISDEKYNFISKGNTFKLQYKVIDNDILYMTSQGVANEEAVAATYERMDMIIKEMGFSTKSKFYSIVDMSRIKGATLKARKLITKYENEYKKYAHLVLVISPGLISLLIKLLKTIGPSLYSHWIFVKDIDEAFRNIEKHRIGNFNPEAKNIVTIPAVIIPDSPSGKDKLINELFQEINRIKSFQENQVKNLLEFTGRLSWDDSLSDKLRFETDSKNPFIDVYNSLIVLRDDFREILEEQVINARLLEESEDNYRNLVNLASDIIMVIIDNKIRFANPAVLSVLQYAPAELLFRPIEFMISVTEREKFSNLIESIANSHRQSGMADITFIHKEGYEVPVSVSAGKITFENTQAILLMIRDNTIRKKAERMLESHKSKLELIVEEKTKELEKEVIERKAAEESEKLKTAFLANMSHEIRTPMNAILAFSEFLRDKNLPEENRQEYINYIKSNGEVLLELINDIIDLAKIESGQVNLKLKPMSIYKMMEELRVLFEESKRNYGKENIEIILDVKDDLKNLVENADEKRLRQVLNNLLDNALKYTLEGKIVFGCQLVKKELQFFISDTGIGIPETSRISIFERFQRVETTYENTATGTGLGLAISKNLVELFGGRIWCEPGKKSGTTFRFTIPHAVEIFEMPQSVKKEAIGCKNYSWNGRIICIAEDDELNFRVLQIAFQKTKADILHAQTGKVALDIVRNQHVDVVLMDLQMPEMDGYESLKEIRKIYPGIPVIAQTAFALSEEREKCLQAGFNSFFAKPIDIQGLMAEIDTYF